MFFAYLFPNIPSNPILNISKDHEISELLFFIAQPAYVWV